MHVLITGGAGFIGSHLTEKLLRERCEVAVLDNLHTGCRGNIPEGVAFIEMDIRDAAVSSVFVDGKFDAVVHLAGQTMVHVSVEDPLFDAGVNVQGTINLLEACRKGGVKRVVFASTAAVYGDIASLPITEEMAVGPASFYGLSKLTVEKYLRMYSDLFGLEYAALRFANVYGERQGDGGEGGVISIFTKKIARGEAIEIFGDGMQTRDFIYAGDIANGIYQALRAERANDVYNLGTQTEISLHDMVAMLKEISGKELQILHGAARAGDIYRSCLSHQKASARLSWRPETRLKEGLAKTYGYFVDK